MGAVKIGELIVTAIAIRHVSAISLPCVLADVYAVEDTTLALVFVAFDAGKA